MEACGGSEVIDRPPRRSALEASAPLLACGGWLKAAKLLLAAAGAGLLRPEKRSMAAGAAAGKGDTAAETADI